MLTLGSVAIAMFFVNIAIPHRARLIGVALLLVPQIYLPGVRIELATLAILWTLMTCIMGLTMRQRPRADSPLVVIMLLFSAVTGVSLLWALPGWLDNGASTVMRTLVFALWLREMIVVAKDDPNLLNTTVLWTAPGIAVQSLLTVLFRVSPSTEARFLDSKFAQLLVGPQSVNLYADWANNVVYPFKAGGLFVNGNIASLFGGVAALLLATAARRTGLRWPYAVAILSIVGSVSTGSKTFIFAAAACALAILLLPSVLNSRWALLAGLPLVILMPTVISLVSALVERVAPGLYAASNRSYDGRSTILQGGLELFKDSPLTGLGFGGWGERIGRFTGQSGLPPHNFLVAAWANSGILAVMIAIVFVIVSLRTCLQVAAAQHSMYDRRTATLPVCAVAWVFLHGMGDNTTLYGEQRSMLLVALVYAYVYTMMPAPPAISRKHSRPAVRHDSIKSLALAGPAEYRGRFTGGHSPR